MATSTAFSTSNEYIKYTISVVTNSQSVSGNYSNVTVSVRFYRTNTGYSTYGSGTVYCTINGTTYSSAVDSSQKITENGIVLFTKTLNIPHSSDGTKTLTCAAYINHSRFTSSSQSFILTLTTIPRASSLTIGNGTLNTAQTVGITRADSSFKHKIKYSCSGTSGYIAGSDSAFSTATSISWTPPISLASKNTSGTTVSITVYLYTYTSSGTHIGTVSKTISCAIPSSVKPTVSIAVSDPTGYLSTYGGYVQGKSKFAITITDSGSYGSTIKSRNTTADGKSYTAQTITTAVISGSGELTIKATVKDSRGRTATASKTVTVIAYSAPKISAFTVIRCGSDGTANSTGAFLKATFSASVTSLSNKNTAAYTLKYKKKADSEYTTVDLGNSNVYSVSNGTKVFDADTGSSYDLVLVVTDAFGSTSKSISGSSISVVWSMLTKGAGFAFGKVAEIANALEVAWDSYFRKNVQIDGTLTLGGYRVRNGLVAYDSAGLDANECLEECFLSKTNTPSSSQWWYITQSFYASKTDGRRRQIATPFSSAGSVYHRYRYNDTWSSWRRCVNDDEKLHGWTLIKHISSTTATDVSCTISDYSEFLLCVGQTNRIYASTVIPYAIMNASTTYQSSGTHQVGYGTTFSAGCGYIGSNKIRMQCNTSSTHAYLYARK